MSEKQREMAAMIHMEIISFQDGIPINPQITNSKMKISNGLENDRKLRAHFYRVFHNAAIYDPKTFFRI